MPFLRRRGNVASETNMRQHAKEHRTGSSALRRLSDASLSNEDTVDYRNASAGTSQNNASYFQQGRASDSTRPETPSVQEENSKHRRFSMLRFRNASDSHLSLRAKQHAEAPPPIPQPPQIITTVPTGETPSPRQTTTRKSLALKLRFSSETTRDGLRRVPSKKSNISLGEDLGRTPLAISDDPAISSSAFHVSDTPPPNPSIYNRNSESSRSDAGSTDQTSQGSGISTPRRPQKNTSLFKLGRARKPPAPLFDLSHLPRKNQGAPAADSLTALAVNESPRPSSSRSVGTHRRNNDRLTDNGQRPTAGAAFLSTGGGRSGHSSPTRATTLLRGRSSTMSSTGKDSTDDFLMPPTFRTSSSTGRKSFSDLLGLSRLRQNSDLSRHGSFTPVTPGSATSKSNSLQLTRESIVLPERREDESHAKYLARAEETVSRGVLGAALSKGADAFSTAVLRSYMRSFGFFGDPMDMSIRKLLMEAELPKETQHIDRFLQAFANRYHECNPGIFSSTDQAYFVAFSLLILHTDVFNKNNKHKMQKSDYLKNTRGEGVCEEVLECFYDNISYTPFIHVEDDLEISSVRLQTEKSSRRIQLLVPSTQDPSKRAIKEPIDPYTLILDANLDILRPDMKEIMNLEEHYNYLGTAQGLNLRELQQAFSRTGFLQIVSQRSRPDAYRAGKTSTNPSESSPGIVNIKVTKVGLLWRKDPKKRKTRSPWQEWGAILTGAQLYFFRNVSWAKNLMHQYEHHIRQGNDGIPIIFKPPLEEFKPDALMSTHGAVALQDIKYKRHKHAFVYVRDGHSDETLLADNEEEMNDWLAKLNYAAAFQTSGVKMRGLGGAFDGHGKRGIRRLESSEPTQTVHSPTGPVSITKSYIDKQMVEDIRIARRHGTRRKIEEANVKLAEVQKQLDEQLQNGRHLQILAPIQPKTREQLLVSAEQIADDLKWIRLEMWKEKCHRDILAQDLEDDAFDSTRLLTPTTTSQSQPEQSPSLKPLHSGANNDELVPRPKLSKDEYSLGDIPSASDITQDVELSLDQVFSAQPQKALRKDSVPESVMLVGTKGAITKHTLDGSTASPNPSTILQSHELDGPRLTESRPSTSRSNRGQDDPDVVERQFLEQAGLLELKQRKDAAERTTSSTSADGGDHDQANDRDKADKAKIRRSLHRTLRDSAGHLSHHRSRKGRDPNAGIQVEDSSDLQLSRGTGSFMVHGKKASVIRLGTELKNMSKDERILARKSAQSHENGPVSSLSFEEDDDYMSAIGIPIASSGSSDRRDSAASASTATARSFRELHRKYSTAQSARIAVGGGKLLNPSDDESEAAPSFSDGPRSPLPPIENDSEDQEEPRPSLAANGQGREHWEATRGGNASFDDAESSTSSVEDSDESVSKDGADGEKARLGMTKVREQG